ncbi:hypothetical protein ACFPIJ_11345 [Dactylosporangium cerinum]|uniref:Uncharacterized protein n=1 Tax=Dactylosporangium cerinum TaxID=1434730 RepID=A0ABV9VT32_9ACTN
MGVWSDARIVQFDPGPRVAADSKVALLWPAWAYRVTAPVLQDRGIDLFQRAVLALCRAGVRQPDRMGPLLHLDPRLCTHIVDRARTAGLLDNAGDITQAGLLALRTGSTGDTPQWQVCYVFQDPFGQRLWPRTVERLTDAWLVGRTPTEAKIMVHGERGGFQRATFVMAPEGPPAWPSAARVVEAASLDHAERSAHEQRQRERRNRQPPDTTPDTATAVPDLDGDARPDLHRVAFVDEPEPVLMLAFLTAEHDPDPAPNEPDPADDELVAHDPFGLGPSKVLHDLVRRQARTDTHLAAILAELTAAGFEQARQRAHHADLSLVQQVQRRLVHEFGPAIRADADALAMMTDLDREHLSAGRDASLKRLAHQALAMYEVLLPRLLHAHPLPQQTLDNYLAVGVKLRRAMLERTARDVGFERADDLFGSVTDSELTKTNDNPAKGYVKGLMTLCLLAVPAWPDHPLRRLARQHPDLLGTLQVLNTLRNRSAHANREAGPRHDADWCRAVGAAAASALLEVPATLPERTPT